MKETGTLYENISVTKQKNSEIEIAGEIPLAAVSLYRTKALKKLSANARIDGFRKGHVSEKVLIQKLGESGVMNEVAELVLSDAYPALVRDKKLDAIGAPRVTLTKLAPGNPIGFKIRTAVIPEFSLPDYKTIAREIMREPDDLHVTDVDIEQVLTEVRRGKARFDNTQKVGTSAKVPSGGEKAPDEIPPEGKSSNEEGLPELEDAFVQTLGDFKTVEDFRARVREDVKKNKEHKALEKKRVAISEKLIEKTSAELPDVLIESELERMFAQMKDDVLRVNMTFEDYLVHTKKTEKDLRNEWRGQAEKRAKLQLILNDIAKKEGISADHGEVHRQMDIILKKYKDAKPENVHAYLETQLLNEAVFAFLEKTE
ncbi:hypothetical protein HYW58_01305 [Candidatus Kaiserbacteria bacterium]|nr:hypothetical protein [Candidatus Kaiserbacteria bacterium]